jgi:hypothetical protein
MSSFMVGEDRIALEPKSPYFIQKKLSHKPPETRVKSQLYKESCSSRVLRRPNKIIPFHPLPNSITPNPLVPLHEMHISEASK